MVGTPVRFCWRVELRSVAARHTNLNEDGQRSCDIVQMFTHLAGEIMQVPLHGWVLKLAFEQDDQPLDYSVFSATGSPSYALKQDAQYCNTVT